MPDFLAYAIAKGVVEVFTVSVVPSVAAMGVTVNAIDLSATDA